MDSPLGPAAGQGDAPAARARDLGEEFVRMETAEPCDYAPPTQPSQSPSSSSSSSLGSGRGSSGSLTVMSWA